MEGILWIAIIMFIVSILYKLADNFVAGRRIKGVKSTTLSDVKMISLPECDYNEMEATIEEQRAMINTLKREKQSLIDSLLLYNIQKSAKMSREVSEDLLKKSKQQNQQAFEQTAHGSVLVREDLLKEKRYCNDNSIHINTPHGSIQIKAYHDDCMFSEHKTKDEIIYFDRRGKLTTTKQSYYEFLNYIDLYKDFRHFLFHNPID